MGKGLKGVWEGTKIITGADFVEIQINKAMEEDTLAAETPRALETLTPIGSKLDAPSATFDESASKEKAIAKKKLGTRGLRIPLTTNVSTTAPKDIQI